MTDVSQDATVDRRGRSWWSTVLVVVLLHATGLGIVAAWSARYFDRLDQLCPWYDSEGTMAAPRSPQGRFVCGAEGVAATYWYLVLGAVAVLLLGALALWLCRRLTLAVVAVLLAVLVPVGIAETSLRLEGTCSKAQWARYGAEGCETDRELR